MKVGKASNTGNFGWVFGIMFILTGCQSTAPIATSGGLDNTSFISGRPIVIAKPALMWMRWLLTPSAKLHCPAIRSAHT